MKKEVQDEYVRVASRVNALRGHIREMQSILKAIHNPISITFHIGVHYGGQYDPELIANGAPLCKVRGGVIAGALESWAKSEIERCEAELESL